MLLLAESYGFNTFTLYAFRVFVSIQKLIRILCLKLITCLLIMCRIVNFLR